MRTGLMPAAAALVVCAFLFSTPAAAQWLTYRAPGIPHLPDGKPNLSAPAPRTADGKPDLSGIWMGDAKYAANLAQDLKPGDVQPWAEQLYQQRLANLSKDRPTTECLPAGLPRYNSGFLARIVQTPGVIVILYEANLSPHREMAGPCPLIRIPPGSATRWGDGRRHTGGGNRGFQRQKLAR